MWGEEVAVGCGVRRWLWGVGWGLGGVVCGGGRVFTGKEAESVNTGSTEHTCHLLLHILHQHIHTHVIVRGRTARGSVLISIMVV